MWTTGYVVSPISGRRIPADRSPDGTIYVVRAGKPFEASPVFARTFIEIGN